MCWKLQSRETREGWPLLTVETRETREQWPLLTVKTRETREGWPLLTVETRETREGWPLLTVEAKIKNEYSKSTNERGPSFGSLGSSCRHKRLLSFLCCSGQPSTKYFFPPRTLFSIYVSPSPSNLGRQLCRAACLWMCVSAAEQSWKDCTRSQSSSVEVNTVTWFDETEWGMDKGTLKTPIPKYRLYWSFLFGVVKQFCRFWIWSETECKTPAEYGLQYNSTPPPLPTDTHCLYILYI